LIDAALELHAGTLLDNVRGFMRRGVEIRGRTECHRMAVCKGFGSQHRGRFARRATLVRCHPGDVVVAEAGLDLRKVGQWSTSVLGAPAGDGCGSLAILRRVTGRLALYGEIGLGAGLMTIGRGVIVRDALELKAGQSGGRLRVEFFDDGTTWLRRPP
jgi:hypothetical protein